MKKIMTVLMFLAMSLCVCSGFIAAPATAAVDIDGVVDCRVDADCDNGLDLYCTSIPFCKIDEKGKKPGECSFIDPCAIYPDRPVCDQLSEYNDNQACVECVETVADSDKHCKDFILDQADSKNKIDSDFDGACIDNQCFQCATDDDCKSENDSCVNGECVPECDTDADCVGSADICYDSVCVECRDDGDCEGATSDCVDGVCKECSDDDDCLQESITGEGEFCNIQGTCREDGTCDNTTDQCTKIGQFCVEEDAKCAWCLEDADCVGYDCDGYDETTGPKCDGNADCRECAIDDDCADESNFCNGTSVCEAGECVFEVPSYTPCATDTLTICDEANDRCVAECADAGDCEDLYGDVENFCNGTRVCNADGTCGYSGTDCPSGQCLPIVQLCYDCEDNGDCTADKFPGRPVCALAADLDPDTNICVECMVDADCGNGFCIKDFTDTRCVECLSDENCAGNEACVYGSCVECDDDEDCPADKPICSESNFILVGDVVADKGPQCMVLGRESNVCVECRQDSDCPKGTTCLEAICPECVPTYDDCGNPDGQSCGDGIAVNECVECVVDSDCKKNLKDDDSAACKLDGVCDNNTNTCSYTNPCEPMDCYPAGAYKWPDAADSDKNIEYYCTDCFDDAECDDGLYCTGEETCVEGDCVDGVAPCAEGLLCQESTDQCLAVDCLTDDNCMFFEECDAQNECVEAKECDLKISPKQMQANKLFARDSWTFKIQGLKGQSGFDPNAPKYFGEQITEIESVAKKGKLKSKVKGDPNNPINPGILTIWVGNCSGTVVLK